MTGYTATGYHVVVPLVHYLLKGSNTVRLVQGGRHLLSPFADKGGRLCLSRLRKRDNQILFQYAVPYELCPLVVYATRVGVYYHLSKEDNYGYTLYDVRHELSS